MAFTTKTDYCGLATTISSLQVRDTNDNVSQSKYQPINDKGEYCAIEVYGADSAPSVNYALSADISVTAGSIKLGDDKTVDSKTYLLESFKVTTSAGAAPTISATSQEVEASPNGSTFDVPALTVSKAHKAQILFGAFTVTNGTLTDCSANVACSVGKVSVAGTKISSDVSNGVITVTATILKTGATAVAVTASQDWTITSPLSCTNPEVAYPSYTVTLEKNLTKTAANQGAV